MPGASRTMRSGRLSRPRFGVLTLSGKHDARRRKARRGAMRRAAQAPGPAGAWAALLRYSSRNLFGPQTMHNAHLGLTVNGEALEASFAPYKTLLEVLREDLGLTGTKHGCELGECGACAVLVDGEPQLSCL